MERNESSNIGFDKKHTIRKGMEGSRSIFLSQASATRMVERAALMHMDRGGEAIAVDL